MVLYMARYKRLKGEMSDDQAAKRLASTIEEVNGKVTIEGLCCFLIIRKGGAKIHKYP